MNLYERLKWKAGMELRGQWYGFENRMLWLGIRLGQWGARVMNGRFADVIHKQFPVVKGITEHEEMRKEFPAWEPKDENDAPF